MDTSRSMHGQMIDAVNIAMHEAAIPIIKESAARYDGRKIQCSILEFNDEVNWILEAVAAEELQWIDLSRRWRSNAWYGLYATIVKTIKKTRWSYGPVHEYSPYYNSC